MLKKTVEDAEDADGRFYIRYARLRRVAPLYGEHEKQSPNETDSARDEKRDRRINLPQQSSDYRGRRDRKTAGEIVKPDRSPPPRLICKVDDHCFSSGFAQFPQSSDYECDYQRLKAVRHRNRKRKNRKANERRDYEGLAAIA